MLLDFSDLYVRHATTELLEQKFWAKNIDYLNKIGKNEGGRH